MQIQIEPYHPAHRDAVLELSMQAWEPVFTKLEPAVPAYVYRAFYPAGWQARQAADIGTFLDEEGERVLIARQADIIAGWVGFRLHKTDRMGEIYIIAVAPRYQRSGLASGLMAEAMSRMKAAGMAMVMVETGGDPGHQPSRATYESAGFQRWPVARYFREL